MEILARRHPGLAAAMKHATIPEPIGVFKSSSGRPTLLWAGPGSRPGFLHSPGDPVLEAERLVENRTFRNQDGTLLLGLGLGYLAKAVLRKKEPHHLLCVAEAIPGIFRLALEHSDLSDLLADEETHFFIGDGIRSILNGFRPLHLKAISGDFNKLALPPFLEIYNGFYDEMEIRIHEHLTSLRQGFITFRATMDASVSNLFENIPAFMRSQAVDSLKGLLRGKPAIVVAAGPSLSTEMAKLKKVRSRCFLIGVDTALKPLLENGFVPDLAVTCDPQPLAYRKIAAVPREYLPQVPLIFCPDACSKVVGSFGATRFVTNSDTSLSRWLLKGRSVSQLPFSGTVAHFGFAVASYMAADPIILVGLDLSFPGESSHADGCTATWEIDMKAWTNLIAVPSNGGGQARTTLPFITMIRQFETDIEKTGARCINVSRDGARIRGAEWMDLEEAAGPGGGTSIDFMPLLAEAYGQGLRIPKEEFLSRLKWLLRELEEMAERVAVSNPVSGSCCTGKMADAFTACMGQEALLNILFDYFPRYLLSFHTLPEEGFPKPERMRGSGYEERVTLFLEEAREIIPLLKEGCLETIRKLDNPLCPYGGCGSPPGRA